MDFLSVLLLLGAGGLVYLFTRRTKSDVRARESDARIDLKALDMEFDRQQAGATSIKRNDLLGDVFNVLDGGTIGKDEFERHDFEKMRSQHVAKLKAAIYRFECPISLTISPYDFENRLFELHVKFEGARNDPERRSMQFELKNSKCASHVFVEVVSIADVEAAKAWKRDAPRAEPEALVLARPIATTSHYISCAGRFGTLIMELVGLRILDKETQLPIIGKLP